ncbi:ABC transporter ATP-binding protein [Bradyrhizobium sp. LHD-71]|uniref:ABC transporter ATP-binding protein n=1 Tax=Bradyrhizobium sp. LHD-71 TaxID=3072141 RepID=UPI00280DE487|nr:ABC transporter ATP-binding protein [Bradyrhizobium sp. LHD-71]MDQ8728284.1 ABC transporter ATP-binding protein [Bradyrhizobium sp. LHD-71]
MSISIENLTKRYGPLTVVHGISFNVAKGEFMSLLGPSGCGKTTTLRCIAGLEDANGGVIRIGDRIVSAPEQDVVVSAHERQIGMVFQSYAIWPHMTVAGNVGFPLAIRKVAAQEVERQVDEALEIVGMRHLRDRHPSQLSGGQQQRVALARAIVGRPRVLLFDEPLSNLDAKLREGTRTEIKRLQRELDVATVYVTHDQEEALSMSDRVIVMDGGRITQAGTPKELYRRPANRFVADFVGRASFIDVTRMNGSGWSTAAGVRLRLDDAGAPPATRYQAMLRPESIDICHGAARGKADESDNILCGHVVESHYLGAYTEYLVEASGAKLKVHSRSDFDVGAEVTLRFAPEFCRLVALGDEDRV